MFWDGASDIFGGAPNVVQFLCLMSIFVNEVGGDLLPIEERVGRPPQHPGIAYAFDSIAGLKHSYNTLAGNQTAFALFRDPAYRTSNSGKALANRFPTPDSVSQAWSGESWPAGFPTSTDPTQTGFLLEADFYKFRGRGLIQTTGRANYARLIGFVAAYTGSDPVLQRYSATWKGAAAEAIATTSSNDDWHQLFFSGTLELARAAIRLHNTASGNYLALAADDAAQLNGTGQGSVYRMGLRISGGSSYASLFQQRVMQICDSLTGAGAQA